jgi:hypothetical protein
LNFAFLIALNDHSIVTKQISLPQMMPDCATSLEDDSLLDNLPAERLSSKATSPFKCGEAQIPYCANNETLVICAPNKALVGVVNCSAQHHAKVSVSNITV